MKNIYSIFLTIMLFAFGLNAQTIKVTFEGDEVFEGDTLRIEKMEGEEIKSYFNLTNMTESLTTANTDEEARELLKLMGAPFAN